MKLSKCSIGTIVTTDADDDSRIGHIVGLDKNSTEEVIPVVLWAGKVIPVSIHHFHIKIFKD